jgi:hypothetical protein
LPFRQISLDFLIEPIIIYAGARGKTSDAGFWVVNLPGGNRMKKTVEPNTGSVKKLAAESTAAKRRNEFALSPCAVPNFLMTPPSVYALADNSFWSRLAAPCGDEGSRIQHRLSRSTSVYLHKSFGQVGFHRGDSHASLAQFSKSATAS